MPIKIVSLQNPRVKELVCLRDARGRLRAGRFIIDGARELSRAMDAGVNLVEAYVCPEMCESADSRSVVEGLEQRPIQQWQVSHRVFEKIAFGSRAEGVLGVAVTPDTSLGRLSIGPRDLLAVLVGVEKPGNVGAVLRSADAAGVSAVIVADGGTDLFNPNCIRASLGTIFKMPVATASSDKVIAWLKSENFPIYAARPDAKLLYSEANFSGRSVIVLGSEATGLSPAWQPPEVTGIRLPMLGIADSLNVSVTAGVLFYEALRQRTVDRATPARRETR